MSAVPEVKRFDPHQPRDRKGRWVETGAEVRNSITRALGTVTRVIRGDNFHENSYEVRTSDGQTQHWETSAIDVVRNRDGSAPGLHKPGTAPGAHSATPAARSAAASAIGEVYAGQAPDKPQAGHSPVDHAVDAVYGQPHPDRPARVADAVGNVYAAQAPDKPQAGRTPVSHAVDATHGTPAAPAARPDLGGAIDAVYGSPGAAAGGIDRSNLSDEERHALATPTADGRRYIRNTGRDAPTALYEYQGGRAKRVGTIPAGLPQDERQARVREFLGSPAAEEQRVVDAVRARNGTTPPTPGGDFRAQLDDRWKKDNTVLHPHTTLGKLQPGDRIHTEGQGTQASPVTLAKPNPSNGVIPANRRQTRTVAHVQRNPDSTHTVHFTDGTSTGTEGGSNIPASDTARSRVYAADAPDAIVAGGDRPPAPAPGPDVTPPSPARPDGLTPRPAGVDEETSATWRNMAFGPHSRNQDAARVHVRNRALREGDVIRVPPGFVNGMQRQQIVGRIDGFQRESMAFSDGTHEVARVRQADGHVVSVPLYSRDDRPVRQFEVYRPGREPRGFATPPSPTPDAPARRFATVADAQAHARTLGNDFIADMAPSDLALSDGGGLLVFKAGRGDWQVNATGPMQSLGGLSSFTTKKDALAFANRIERENPNVHFSGDDLKDQMRAGQGIRAADLLRSRVAFDRERGATDANSRQWAEQLASTEAADAEHAARDARMAEQGYTDTRSSTELLPGDEVAFTYIPRANRAWTASDGSKVKREIVTVRAIVTGPGVEMDRSRNNHDEGVSGMRYPLADATFETSDGRTGPVPGSPTMDFGQVHVRPVSERPVADMSDEEIAAQHNRLDPTVPGNASLQGNPRADDIRARLDALAGERQRRDTERANVERQIRDEAEREAGYRADAAEQFTEGDLVTYPNPVTGRPEIGTVERINRTGAVVPGQVTGPDSPPPDAHMDIRNRRDGTLHEHVDPTEVRDAGEQGQRPTPEVPDGPLAEPVRTALAAINGTEGMSDYDLDYYAGQLRVVAAGNADREYGHDIVRSTRNTIINTTDGGARTDAMNALDALDTAIDTHEDSLNPPLPPGRFPMPTSDQLDRAIGDLDAADVPDMTTPEIMGHIATLDPLVNGWVQGRGDRSNPFYAQAVEVLDALEAERGTRDDVPVDPGGTGSLFGEDATPDVPAGESVRASDLAVGDSISYTTADNIVVSGEIEGLHTAGPNIVATLRMPDDRRETRAFRRDAEVNRTAAAAPPPTEDAPARDLRMGQRILLQDASGAYRPATIVHVTRDPGGSGLAMEVMRDNGTHESTIVDPSEVLPRITNFTVDPEPDLPPIPDDPQPEDGTKFARGLVAGDRIASYGDTITVVRSQVSPDGQTVAARVRLASGAEDNVTWSADAVLPLVDQPSTVAVEPHPADAASLRPTLYTYQRKGIVALNLDAQGSGQSPVVQQAAARVRNRQALTEEQNAALADALRAQADAPGVRAPRQRSLQRQAASFDAAAAALGGRVPPVTPNRDTVQKTRPGNLVEGDWVALRGQGAAGGVDVVQVLGMRPMMGGRLHELTVRDQNDNVSRRLVAGNADTYLLPDLPRDLPAAPEQPRPEHITPDRVNVGDTVRFAFFNPDTGETETREGAVAAIEQDSYNRLGRTLVFNVGAGQSRYSVKDQSGADGGPTVVRTARGPSSQEQPYDSLLPAEGPPEVVSDVATIAVGDRISVPYRFGAPQVGTVHQVDIVKGEDGSTGAQMLLRLDDGTANSVTVFNGDSTTVTRLAKGDAGAGQRIRDMYAERARSQQASAVAREITSYRSRVAGFEINLDPRATAEDAATTIEALRDGVTVRGQSLTTSHADRIAERLSDDPAQRSVIASRIVQTLRQVRAETLTSIAESMRQTPPDQSGPDNMYWTVRVLNQWSDTPPSRDYGRISRTLLDAADAIHGDGGDGEQGLPAVNLPEGADLRTRIAAYKAALPGGEAFGKRRVTRTVFKAPSLDDLEAGRVPETETTAAFVEDRAADGGPGETAMQHHDVLLAAGRDLDGEMRRRLVARDSGLGSDPEATLANLTAEHRAAASDAMNAMFKGRDANERAALAGTGYGSIEDVRRQFRLAETRGDAARVEELRNLINSVEERTQAQREEAQASYRAASERSEALGRQVRDMSLRLGRLRRDVAMELLAEHRQTGGVRMDWVDNKGKVIGERSILVKAMRSAEDVYPTEWLQRFKDRTKGRFTLKNVKRGFFSEHQGVIALSDKAVKMEGGGTKDDVAVHELGHGMEWVVPGLTAAEEALLWARTSDGPVGSRTRQKKTKIYAGENGWKDEFPEHYTGKDYGGKFHEVFTTTVESVFAGSNYADDNLRQWLLGSMVLL